MTKDARTSLGALASSLGGSLDAHGGIRGTLQGLGTGLAFGAVAILAKIPLVEGSGGDLGYVLYVAAIGLAAWFRGLSGGLGATLVTAAANTYLFVHPGEFVPETTSEQVRLVIYLMSGIVVAGLFQSLRVERDLLARALDEGAIGPETQLFCENGRYPIGKHTIHDHKGMGWSPPARILAASSNICSAKVGQKLAKSHALKVARSAYAPEKDDEEEP